MIFKLIIVALLLVILYSLGSALFYLVRNRGNSTEVVKMLSWRIGFSVIVFALLLIGASLGWITPHGV